MGQGLIIGEPAGGDSPRVRRLGELLRRAGFDTTLSSHIRQGPAGLRSARVGTTELHCPVTATARTLSRRTAPPSRPRRALARI